MTQFKIPITIIDDGSLTGELFHPGKPDQFDWQAGNTAASILQGVRSVWSNLAHYINSAQKFEGYERKLQYKAALCELKILVDILPSFHSFLMKQNIFNGTGLRREISITHDEKRIIGEKYKSYCQNKELVEPRLSEIRNNIAAHFADPQIRIDEANSQKNRAGARKKLLWDEIEYLWDSINIFDFVNLILSIQNYLNFSSNLELYEFYRKEPDGIIRTHIPYTGYEDENGCLNICLGSPELFHRIGLDSEEKINHFINNSRKLSGQPYSKDNDDEDLTGFTVSTVLDAVSLLNQDGYIDELQFDCLSIRTVHVNFVNVIKTHFSNEELIILLGFFLTGYGNYYYVFNTKKYDCNEAKNIAEKRLMEHMKNNPDIFEVI